MHVFALDPGSADWSATLADVYHDVYHLPEYVAFAARRQIRGQPWLFVVEEDGERALFPLIVRPIPDDLGRAAIDRWDATSSRGYPGAIAGRGARSGEVSPEFLGRAIDALGAALQERGIVSLYLRMHPLLALADEPFRARGALVEHGDTVYVNLQESDDDWRRKMRHGHRHDINRSRRQGYEARIDEGWERFDEFVEMFAESMERVGATDHWRLGRDYFVDLRTSLGARLHLCVAEREGAAAAAALLTEVDGIVEYHLAATADAHLKASPSKLVLDHARTWAKGRGNRVLHLTGSLSRGDSLSNFKRGFSPLELPVRSWRFVSDPLSYSELVQAWERRTRLAPGDAEGFFPWYRQPTTDPT